ncbi:MAG: PstS family phosphate ABC transporter substrate-binding protein [Steroidobacteraceae bacterium]
MENSDGRPLPKPELVRPDLDGSLLAFIPCKVVSGERHGSAPAILPDLVRRWISAFQSRQVRVRIVVPPPYEAPQAQFSRTLREFIEGKRHFAFMSRELLADDRAAFRIAHGGMDPIAIPVAIGSFRHFGFVDTVVLVVHPANPLDSLTFRQIDGIYSAERLRGHPPVNTWGDLGLTSPVWQGRPVVVLGGGGGIREDSAKAAALRKRVLQIDDRMVQWSSRSVVAADDDSSVLAQVARSPGAIGITALGHVTPAVKVLAVAEGDSEPGVEPTQQNVYDGRYPLTRSINLLIAPLAEGTMDPLLGEWARFVLSREGQAIVLDQGIFLPLRGNILRQAEAQLTRTRGGACYANRMSD